MVDIRELREVLYVVTSEATTKSNVSATEIKPIILFTFQFTGGICDKLKVKIWGTIKTRGIHEGL